ncbi:hypothetical protein ACQW02_14395 [Humitalea sp. 24SJ18S-53]|uniref:hypothetical protein n=1 Tax=Humitalea sp. 24SJ18S-53 TaxID=3422307 RepID=UPI003D66D79B
MRIAVVLCTALATISLAAPSQSQTRTPPGGDAAITEMQRAGPDPAIPAVPQQNRAGAAADTVADVNAGTMEFLKQSQDALRRGNLGVANELLERAATRMLSRSTLATEAGVPMRDARLGQISAARAALMSRDRAEAMRQIDLALAGG